MLQNYLNQIGLEELIPHIGEVELNDIVEKVFAAEFPELSKEEVKKLYVYDVPKMSADGACSIIEEKAEKPYNLAETFGLFSHPGKRSASRISYRSNKTDSGHLPANTRRLQAGARMTSWVEFKNHPQTIRLWRLRQIVGKIFAATSVDWFGIYRKVQNLNDETVLVKEAYEGLFSRAEFPLTKEFAKKSNNSTVGLTGKAIVIQDVAAHTGSYYKCDGKVNSEFCVPILSKDFIASLQNDKLEVIGIIDAEAFATNHYTQDRLLQIAKVAFDLGGVYYE